MDMFCTIKGKFGTGSVLKLTYVVLLMMYQLYFMTNLIAMMFFKINRADSDELFA